MNAPFQFTPQATEDLDAIWWFIAERSRLVFSGTVTDPGVPEAGVPVELVYGTSTLQDVTDNNGNFAFYIPLAYPGISPLTATLVVGGGGCGTLTETVAIGSSATITVARCVTLTVATNPTGLQASIGASGP